MNNANNLISRNILLEPEVSGRISPGTREYSLRDSILCCALLDVTFVINMQTFLRFQVPGNTIEQGF